MHGTDCNSSFSQRRPFAVVECYITAAYHEFNVLKVKTFSFCSKEISWLCYALTMSTPLSLKVAYYSFIRVQEVYTINVQI